MRSFLLASFLILANTGAGAAQPTPSAAAVPGVGKMQLDVEYWASHAPQRSRIILDKDAIAAQNQRLLKHDPSLHDIENLPSTLDGSLVRAWLEDLAPTPDRSLWDEQGVAVTAAVLAPMRENSSVDKIPKSQQTRYGLITRRADLRTLPTRLRVFDSQGNTDIDRFQETALFPGTPLVIAHESRDHQWWFVVSPLYAAWVEKAQVAEGSKDDVFAYTRRSPSLVVAGATARTVFTPEQPAVSELQLDMGVRVPVLADWPANAPVNGQNAYAGTVIQLPIRREDGSLELVPALLPHNSDVARDYLPLTSENIVRQGFKFLGERYGWGHGYNARDCSGFVSEVYRSFGVQLPRNSSDQGRSPVLNGIAFDAASTREQRLAAIKKLRVGDLIYIPGHVMMVLGFEHGQPYVIHDTTGMTYQDTSGGLNRIVLNGVSVTPLIPLLFNKSESYIDRMYSIQRIRP
jgi:cell wall-associated NlpC family hydrolase